MQCNIDAKGKATRLVIGLAMVIVGATALLVWQLNNLAWWLALACIGCGVFAVIEGWSGWCVVRAMGFKTRV